MSRKHYSTKLFYKYYLTHRKIKELAPELHMNELTRQSYQKLLNNYAATHEKQTTLDFHHHLKAALVDALDEGLLEHDPTRRAIIKGVDPSNKKNKFLNLYELQKLLRHLDLGDELNWDWFILLVSKTGLRFAEALALTPEDFDFERQQIIVNKSWNYKTPIGNFQKTKNESSNRVVMVDWHLMNQFKSLIRNKESDWPIFVPHNKRVFNSTVNGLLEKYCYKLDIPTISVHGLRHTHASLLLYEGVSVASVAKRLGHANTTTTQETYIHIIEELENKDNDKVLHHLSQLN